MHLDQGLVNDDTDKISRSAEEFKTHMSNAKTYGTYNVLVACCELFNYGYLWITITLRFEESLFLGVFGVPVPVPSAVGILAGGPIAASTKQVN